MRLEYQLEVNTYLYMEKIQREHLKFKPNTVKRVYMCICTLPNIFMCIIITVYLYQTVCVQVAVAPALE